MELLSRHDAIDVLRRSRATIRAAVDRLTDEEIVAAGTVSGGQWSVKDLIGHLTSWEEIAMERISWAVDGVPPDPPPFPGVDAVNAQNLERKRALSLSDVREEAAVVRAGLLDAIASLTDEQWAAPLELPDTETRPLGEVLARVLSGDGPFDHDLAHAQELEAYLSSLGKRAEPS